MVVEKAHRKLLALAGDHADSPLAKAKYDQIEARDGGLFRTDDRSKGETYEPILRRAGQDSIDIEASSSQPLAVMRSAMASYGAQFCELRVNESSGEVRVVR